MALAAAMGIVALAGCVEGNAGAGETIGARLEQQRAYDLVELDGQSPARNLRLWSVREREFAVCGKCVCLTGVFTGRYPEFDVMPTSGSPSLECDMETAEFEADVILAGRFAEMERGEVRGETVVFSDDAGHRMVFRLAEQRMVAPHITPP